MADLFELILEAVKQFNAATIEIGAHQLKKQQDKNIDIQNQSFKENHVFLDQYSMYSIEADNQFYLFDSLPDNIYNQSLDAKISNIKMNSVSVRRKDQLFKRQKRQQQQKIVQRRKQLEQKYPFNATQLKFQGQFAIKKKQKNEILAFKAEDFQKLRYQTDLNDTIIDNYLKIMQTCILSEQISNKTFIFSTFFMGKLLGDQLKDDLFPERQVQNSVQKTKKKVIQSYSTMKRWTKKIDLFSKQYIVIPINAYKHWNCMIVVSPNALLSQPSQCKIIYLDSMCEKKAIFPQAIRTFLELQLADRKNINASLQNIVQTYQLLVPRQTNTHDCGLYTLCYIEYMLKNHQILDQNFELIKHRQQLRLFPRSIIFTMRQALRQLFKNLLIYQNKDQVIKQYINLRTEIQKNSNQSDFDEINERQYKKYYRLNSHLLEDKKKKQSQIQYQCKVKFYLDFQVNHYQKDMNCQ